MAFILHRRGATAHEGQVGRIAWRLPYWRYLKASCCPSIYIAPKDQNTRTPDTNLPASKATAKLMIALAESHVEKAMSEGKVDLALVFQSIITALNLALKTGAPIEFK